MANGRYDYDDEEQAVRVPKKADVILKRQQEMAVKQNETITAVNASNTRLDEVLAELAKSRDESAEKARHGEELYGNIGESIAMLRRELKFLAAQNESIFTSVAEKISVLDSAVNGLKNPEAAPVDEAAVAEAASYEPVQTTPVEIDYETLANKVAERIELPAPQIVSDGTPVQTVVQNEELDYDVLVDRIIARLPVQEVTAAEPAAAVAEIDYDTLAEKVAERMPAPQVVTDGASVQAMAVPAEIDYEELARKVAALIEIPAQPAPVYEPVQVSAEIDYDTLAEKVAERIPAPQIVTDGESVQTVAAAPVEIDYETLASKVAERIELPAQVAVAPAAVAEPVQVSAELDYDLLADKVIARIPVQEAVSSDYIAAKVAEQLIMPEAKIADFDYDTLAEKVAERIPAPRIVTDGEGVQTVAAAPVVEIDYETLANKVAERIEVPAPQVAEGEPVQTVVHENAEIDYERLAELISEYMPVQETVVEQSDAQLDYETLADKVAERITLPEVAASAVSGTELDEEELADRIALKLGAIKAQDFDIVVDDEGCREISKEISDKLDYELIAATVAEKLGSALDADNGEETDYDEMAARISEKITVAGVNEDAIAEKAAAVLSNYLPEMDTDEIADKVAAQVINSLPAAEVDSEAISSAVAEKLNERQAEIDYDIVLDDEGLDKVSASVSDRISRESEERLSAIENELAELKALLESGVKVSEAPASEPDYEEMASRISENITVAGVDEDAIAQKAAAVLSEYVYDTDVIAEKVADKVIENLPSVNNQEIAETVADRVVVAMPVPVVRDEEERDYNIVMDEDGINEVSERVTQGTEERFDAIDREIAEIKRLLESGKCVIAVADREEETASVEAYEVYEDEPEEELVTVSDVIAEEPEETESVEAEESDEGLSEPAEIVEEEAVEDEEEQEEVVEEIIEPELQEENEEAAEETSEEVTEEDVEEAEAAEEVYETTEETVAEETAEDVTEQQEEVVEEIAEEAEPVAEETQPEEEAEQAQEAEEAEDDSDEEVVEEFTYEDMAGGEGGVDFANMMRYNRSFIARIIQGSDEQKTYYGEVRNALLSYKKVNSNIAWGAERFHKGRETIARFKIRGKTLILYLALDPATHEYSVYHHKDVSDNKSVAGTPMMIKVKSPLGVKKAVRLIDEMLAARNGEKRNMPQRDYAAMYPYETIEELIEDGLVKDVRKDK